MNKVVFYSKEDLSVGQNLSLAEKILDSLDFKNLSNINDIIEIYNINLFFENNLYLLKWTVEEKENYFKKNKEGWKVAARLFVDWINHKGLTEFYNIDFNYTKHFWEIIEKLKLFDKIDKIELKNIINNESFFIREILMQPNTVKFFHSEIKEYFLEKKDSAEILLTQFEQEHLNRRAELYFPKSFTEEVMEKIILNYLDYENANINYVRLIVKARNIKLSERTKFNAKKLSEKLNEEISLKGFSWQNTIEITVSKDQIEPKIVSSKENRTSYSYSEKVLMSDLSPETILGNFASTFEFTNKYGCINLVTKNHEIDSFESVISMRSKNEYFVSTAFHFKNLLSHLQLEVYSHLLNLEAISIEKKLEQIITVFIKSEFNVNGFKIIMPNQQLTILEKIRMIAPEIESLLRQYNSYVEEGYVNFELIQFSSSQLHFGEVKSLVDKKYIYLNDHEITQAINYFFRGNSVLYSEPYIGKYHNFYQLITTEDISYSNLIDIDRQTIDFLLEKEYLFIDDLGILQIKNINRIYILAILQKEEVISYWYLPNDIRNEIDSMVGAKLLRCEEKLFTVEEKRFFNYYLNKKFTNGLDLRNKYMHGTNSFSYEEQEKDYKILIKILLLVTLKILDDIYIYNEKRNLC